MRNDALIDTNLEFRYVHSHPIRSPTCEGETTTSEWTNQCLNHENSPQNHILTMFTTHHKPKTAYRGTVTVISPYGSNGAMLIKRTVSPGG